LSLKDKITIDAHLWNEFRKGNNLSFEEIYQANVKSLFQYGLKLTSDRELVKDCIHELFVELYNHRKTLGVTDKIKPYLITCFKRKLIKLIQSNQKNISLNPEDLPFLVDYSLETQMDLEETDHFKKKFLSDALNNLSSRQKEAVYLRFIEGLSYNEISEVLKLNYQSARNLIHRAIERMREIITNSNINLCK